MVKIINGLRFLYTEVMLCLSVKMMFEQKCEASKRVHVPRQRKVLSGESCWCIQGTPKGQVCLKRTGE